MRIDKIIIAPVILSAMVYSAQIDESNLLELKSFAMQKYHLNYDLQNDKTQQEIALQYANTKKLSQTLEEGAMKDDIDLKVAMQLLRVEIWGKKFLQNAKVSDEKLHELYTQLKPMVNAQYKVRSVALKDEAQADALLKNSADGKTTDKQMEEVASKLHLKVFASDLVDINKFEASLRTLLSSRNKGEIFKFPGQNKQWNVLYVEDMKPSRQATWEEAKAKLTLIAKQKMLDDEIKKIVNP